MVQVFWVTTVLVKLFLSNKCKSSVVCCPLASEADPSTLV